MPLTDNNPLYHSEYLLGPIETIVYSHEALASGHLSLHDLMEAYRTLSMRIRQSSCHLSVASDSFPALERLRDKGSDVVAALRRDILWASRVSASHTSGDLSLRSSDPTALSAVSTTHNTNRTTDLSTLCHYALRLLSELFRFPALSSAFTAQDLGHLLGDVISIIRCPQSPSYNVSKTIMLSSWIVRTQKLPKDILLSRMEDLILYLKFILETAVRGTCVVVTVVDALNCIVNLLTFHQHHFVARLTDLLPSVFPFAMHTSSELRHYAAVVLVSFSQALIAHRTLVSKNTLETICFHTHSFLTPETTRRPTSSRKLPPLLEAAVLSKNCGGMGANSPWALTVVASFAVLLGPSLFLHHGPLKLVMNIAQKAQRHRPGRGLNPHVWRTFIWSMTQLYIHQSSTTKGDIGVAQRCVLVLKQALHAGLGAALISSLLEATSTDFRQECQLRWAIPSVIDIIHDMLSSKYRDIRDEAYRIFGCLTRRIGAASNQQREIVDALLSQYLFDGSLLRADKVQVEEMVDTTRVFSPRCLSQEEILTHWRPISSCFVVVVRNCFKDDNAYLTTMALPVWQSLLLAHAQPIRENGQPAASTDFGSQLTSLLSQFLPDPSVTLSGEAKSIELQLQSLVISKQLWIVVQDVFSQPWLTPVASSFLRAILQRTFYLADQEVLTNWSQLCSALIVLGIPDVLESIPHQDEAQHALEIKRQLWRLVTTHFDSSMHRDSQNLTSILVFPLGSWVMSDDDLDIWERVLEQNLSATAMAAKAVDIIDSISSNCPAIGPSYSINAALRVALAILRHLNFDEGGSIPVRIFSYLSTTLAACYPPQSSTVDAASKLIKDIRRMIISAPVISLEPVIFALQTGLAVWIEDMCVSLSAEQYNDLLMPLYDSLLTRLQSLPISLKSLNALVPLLTAAFSHIPPPALGPAAFHRFFYGVHARLAAQSNAYSDELRVCLDACVRGYGGEWPSGMVPLTSSSQTQTQLQLEASLLIEASAPLAVREDVGEQIPHVRSIEHEVIPDSQCATSNAALGASSLVLGSVLRSSRPVYSRLPNGHNVPSPTHLITELRESRNSRGSTRAYDSPALKRRHLPQDMPAAKRHRAVTSTKNELRTHSVPLPRASALVVPGPRSHSTPKTSPRHRMVMDCVEVVPLRELLRRREAEAARDDMGRQQQSEQGDHAREVTPQRPFVPRMTRGLLERDEIVPETPDAVLRPTRMSLPTGKESSPSNDSPTRLLCKVQRAPSTSTRLAAALGEVHDVVSRPGLSQIPPEALVDSARLLDAAHRQLRRALGRNTSKNMMVHPT